MIDKESFRAGCWPTDLCPKALQGKSLLKSQILDSASAGDCTVSKRVHLHHEASSKKQEASMSRRSIDVGIR